MKSLFTAIAIIAPLALHAEDIAKPSSLSVRTKEVASRRKDTSHWKTDYGSHDTTTARGRSIEVEVTNFGGKPAPGAKVIIYWIARSGSSLYVVGQGERELDLKEILKTIVFESPEISERNTEYVIARERYKRGDRLVGNVVMLDYQGYDYPVVSSTGASAVRDKQDLEALLSKTK